MAPRCVTITPWPCYVGGDTLASITFWYRYISTAIQLLLRKPPSLQSSDSSNATLTASKLEQGRGGNCGNSGVKAGRCVQLQRCDSTNAQQTLSIKNMDDMCEASDDAAGQHMTTRGFWACHSICHHQRAAQGSGSCGIMLFAVVNNNDDEDEWGCVTPCRWLC